MGSLADDHGIYFRIYGTAGKSAGCIIWFIANIIFWFVKRKMFEVGYTSGTKLITNLGKSLTTFTEAASIMGLSVVGALIASSVK